MAERNIDLHLRALGAEQTQSALTRLGQGLTDLKRAARPMTDIMQIVRGGGIGLAVIGVAQAVEGVANAVQKAKEEGQAFNDVLVNFQQSVPLLGRFARAFEAVGTAIYSDPSMERQGRKAEEIAVMLGRRNEMIQQLLRQGAAELADSERERHMLAMEGVEREVAAEEHRHARRMRALEEERDRFDEINDQRLMDDLHQRIEEEERGHQARLATIQRDALQAARKDLEGEARRREREVEQRLRSEEQAQQMLTRMRIDALLASGDKQIEQEGRRLAILDQMAQKERELIRLARDRTVSDAVREMALQQLRALPAERALRLAGMDQAETRQQQVRLARGAAHRGAGVSAAAREQLSVPRVERINQRQLSEAQRQTRLLEDMRRLLDRPDGSVNLPIAN